MASAFRDQEISSLKPTRRDLLNFMLQKEDEVFSRFLPFSAGSFGGKVPRIPGQEDLRGSVIDRLIQLVKGKKFPTASAGDIKQAVLKGKKINPGVSREAISGGSSSRPSNIGMSVLPSEKHIPGGGALRLATQSFTPPKSNLSVIKNIREILDRMGNLRRSMRSRTKAEGDDPSARPFATEGNLKNALKANIRQFRALNPKIKSSKEAKKDILRRVKRLGTVVTDEAEFDRLLREEGFGER